MSGIFLLQMQFLRSARLRSFPLVCHFAYLSRVDSPEFKIYCPASSPHHPRIPLDFGSGPADSAVRKLDISREGLSSCLAGRRLLDATKLKSSSSRLRSRDSDKVAESASE